MQLQMTSLQLPVKGTWDGWVFYKSLPKFQNQQQTCITCWASPKMYFSTSLCSISSFCRWTWDSSSSSLFIFHSTSSEEEDSKEMDGTSATESRWPGHCQHCSYISQSTAAQIRRFILILSTSMTPWEDKKKRWDSGWLTSNIFKCLLPDEHWWIVSLFIRDASKPHLPEVSKVSPRKLIIMYVECPTQFLSQVSGPFRIIKKPVKLKPEVNNLSLKCK